MTYATVMVSLALDQPNEARLQVAGELAERFEASVVSSALLRRSSPRRSTTAMAPQRRD
ncbi:hypothetical protein ACVWZK_007399 [Bradyrhizobium sp. GM0.4]